MSPCVPPFSDLVKKCLGRIVILVLVCKKLHLKVKENLPIFLFYITILTYSNHLLLILFSLLQ